MRVFSWSHTRVRIFACVRARTCRCRLPQRGHLGPQLGGGDECAQQFPSGEREREELKGGNPSLTRREVGVERHRVLDKVFSIHVLQWGCPGTQCHKHNHPKHGHATQVPRCIGFVFSRTNLLIEVRPGTFAAIGKHLPSTRLPLTEQLIKRPPAGTTR
jgi:hypothetical protein